MSDLSVAVYGDSFANFNLDKPDSYCWLDILRTKYDVVNFGCCGNSVYQCYKDYKVYKNDYDYHVFLIPNLQRFYSKRLGNLFHGVFYINNNNWYSNIGGVKTKEIQLSNRKDLDPNHKLRLLTVVKNVKFAIEDWLDQDYLKDVNWSLIDSINNDKNLILVDTNSTKDNIGLTDICFKELEWIGYKEYYLNKGIYLQFCDLKTKTILTDIRCNHFSKENNIILGNIILDAIDNNFSGMIKLSYEQFVKPPQPIDYYLKWLPYE